MCEIIQTRSDTVYEDNEILTLSLTSNHPNIVTDGSTARVTIIDDDGNLYTVLFTLLAMLFAYRCYSHMDGNAI